MGKKNIKTNAVRILEDLHLPLTLHEYPHVPQALDGPTVARLIGKDPASVYKTLVTCEQSNKPSGGQVVVCVIPVAAHLDLKKAARAAGVKHLEMLDLKELTRVTGYVRGGCSPIGMKKSFPIFIEEAATLLDTMVVSAGKIGHQVELSPPDLARAAGARFADLIQ